MTAWLLTWLWQGSALAGGIAVALACAPRVNAATRHLIWWGGLIALAWIGWASSPYGSLTAVIDQSAEPVYVPSAPDTLITVFVGVWAAIALVSLLRLLPGLHGVYALRDRCEPFPTNIESRLPLWREAREKGRTTQLMICDAVPGATVLGFERPCIAIPSSLVAGLTIDELDLVILHEHAHVQRRDDWWRLAQALLLPVLCVHPAALFVSRALSREREMACDEWVVARTGQPKAYARCLARAAELRLQMRGGPPLVPALVGGRHELLRRVDRLLAMRATPRRHLSLASATIAAVAMVTVSVQLQGVRFAELAEIVLPVVRVQPVQWVQQVQEVQGVRGVREVREVRGEVEQARAATTALVAPDPAPVAPLAPIAPIAPDAPDAPSLSARTLAGAYSHASTFAPTAQIASVDKPTAPLALLAPIAPLAPRIASTAKKTSLGVASAFTRAGVSLARSF